LKIRVLHKATTLPNLFLIGIYIGCIKYMIRHMRNISISIKSIRNMVSIVEALLLLLIRVTFHELEELFAI
jgi:hypothetical protein